MQIAIYIGVVIGSVLLLGYPFTKRGSSLKSSEKSAFVLAGILAAVWVILGFLLISEVIKSPEISMPLATVKSLACGTGSGIVLTLALCGYFDFPKQR